MNLALKNSVNLDVKAIHHTLYAETLNVTQSSPCYIQPLSFNHVSPSKTCVIAAEEQITHLSMI